jgi:methionyl-tRNA formyltransferase
MALSETQFQAVIDALGLKTEMAKEILKLALQNVVVFDKKQLDYGSGNIAAFMELGVLVRCNDKIERLKNLTRKGQMSPNNESIVDSWLDLANYGLIGALCNKGIWK